MAEDTPAEKRISIQKIYLKDFSFESPQTPQVFTEGKWEPKTNLNLRSTHSAGKDNHHEVVLTVTIDTRHDDRTIFLIELQQAGLFYIAGYDKEELSAVVGSFCPNLLYPYAREAISSIVSKGGFPELLLQPINFDALYAQARAEARNRVETQTSVESQPAGEAIGEAVRQDPAAGQGDRQSGQSGQGDGRAAGRPGNGGGKAS